MKRQNFLNVIASYGYTVILDNEAESSEDYRLLTGLKKVVKSIDFGCNWEDGKCTGHEDSIYIRKDNPACCCVCCAEDAGYLKSIVERYIDYYAKNFDKEKGFWREDKGCILPVVRRSRICLCYACHHFEGNFELEDVMRDYETKLINKYTI